MRNSPSWVPRPGWEPYWVSTPWSWMSLRRRVLRMPLIICDVRSFRKMPCQLVGSEASPLFL